MKCGRFVLIQVSTGVQYLYFRNISFYCVNDTISLNGRIVTEFSIFY